ncbi:PLD nuclease N-terminal domain-containing protein [Plantactinospora sp. WMMC1484]|uniref:PLD nuclease N-terminal domain-containing protein n=1 Tax=Plantactinospora sp. WMMC1484 TaxID=3404122 RepID=UPI003BF56AA3
MVRLYALLAVIQLVLAVFALISCLSAEDDEIRALPRFAWVLIILFFPLVGSIAWFVAGRPQSAGRPTFGTRPAGGRPSVGPDRRVPVAPDDDPEFLRSLDSERSKQDRELLDRWERDLRRREEELRRREDQPPRPEGRAEPGDQAGATG